MAGWPNCSAAETDLAVQLSTRVLRARTRCGPSDRLDERLRGPAEVAGGAASLIRVGLLALRVGSGLYHEMCLSVDTGRVRGVFTVGPNAQ